MVLIDQNKAAEMTWSR